MCGGCGKTYLGHKRMQEHLERFPAHKNNTTEQQVDSELHDIFQDLNETTINSKLFWFCIIADTATVHISDFTGLIHL